MAPFDFGASLGYVWLNIFYVLTGVGFGFALERSGFGNSRNLAAQFYLTDMRVFKVMFTAIITAMLLIFWFSALGLLDYQALYVNPTYLWPGIVGGLVFGAGFVIGGYCPGTSLVSTATLKLDGLFFVLGMGLGMFIFGETIGAFRLFWETSGLYGDVTLPEVINVQAGVVVFVIVAGALGLFWGAEKVEAVFQARAEKGGNR